MQKILLTLIITFLFTGCGKQDTSTPKWYLISPTNNANFIYGVGEGYTLQEAKNNALNDMSSRLIVSVGSVMNTKTTSSTTGIFVKKSTKDVTVEAKKIKFNNAKVEKTKQIDNTIYLLIKVNKNELFREKKKELLAQDRQLDKKYIALKSKSALEQIFALQDLTPNIMKAQEQAFVLYAINNLFNYEQFTAKYDDYLSEVDKLKSSISVSVQSDDKNRFFADIISKMLNQNKYKIVDTNADIKINLTNKIRYSVARGWQIAKVDTTISVTTSNKKTLANTIIKTTGRSSSTKQNALNGASKYFNRKVKELGIDKILFLKDK